MADIMWTVVTLQGQGFSVDTQVFFGDRPAASVQFVDETLLLVTTPRSHKNRRGRRSLALLVDVTVVDVGTRAVSSLGFRYGK